jgi:hypothetical protein
MQVRPADRRLSAADRSNVLLRITITVSAGLGNFPAEFGVKKKEVGLERPGQEVVLPAEEIKSDQS